MLLCMLETVEGGLCLLEVMRCVLLCMLEVFEVSEVVDVLDVLDVSEKLKV